MSHPPRTDPDTDGPEAGTVRPRPGPVGWRRVVWFVGSVLARVFRDPVRYGRLRVIDWPRGLGAVTVCAGIAYVVAAGMAVLAPWLRARLDLAVLSDGTGGNMPAALAWVVLALVFLAVGLLQTGALHAVWWLRLLALAVSLVALCTMARLGDHPGSVTQAGWLAGCWAVLVALQLVRWRSSFRWWEFVVVGSVFGIGVLSAHDAVRYSDAMTGAAELQFAGLAVSQLAFLAGPVALAAGFAVAQIGFATVVWTVDLGRRELPRWVLTVALIVVLAWRAYAEVAALTRADVQLDTLLWPAGLVLAGAGLWILLDRIADRKSPGTTRVADLREDLRFVLTPIALAVSLPGLTLPLVTLPLGYVANVAEVGGASISTTLHAAHEAVRAASDPAADILAWVVAGALVIAAVLLARRGNRGAAELIGLVGVIHLAVNATSLLFATQRLGLWAVLVLIMLTVLLAIRRRLTPRRTQSLLVGAGLATLLSTRGFFADPMNVVLSGTAALFLSLVWTMLTSGDDANGDSRRFPRSARVCLVLASGLFGMAVLSFQNLTSQISVDGRVLELENAFGDGLFGGALLLGALVVIIGNVLRDTDLGTPEDLEAIAVHPSGQRSADPHSVGVESPNTESS